MDSTKGMVIVAIPSPDDYVWKISSEKVPHLTLMYLGDQSDSLRLDQMVQHIQHVAKTSMCKFGMSVKHRGLLGDNDADVLFLESYGIDKLKQVRSYFLADPEISKAYESAFQYPEWTPHLTLGYPDAPAKPDKREHPGLNWINFDRIALWTGDYDGPEFQLMPEGYGGEVRMGDEAVRDALAHFGVKGMKWGVTRSHPAVKLATDHKDRIRDTLKIGGKDSEDASSVKDLRRRARKGGARTLTDAELKKLVDRVELERKYKKIADADKEASKKFIADIMSTIGKELISEFIKFKFRGKSSNSGGGFTRTTAFQGRVIEGSTRSLSR